VIILFSFQQLLKVLPAQIALLEYRQQSPRREVIVQGNYCSQSAFLQGDMAAFLPYPLKTVPD
jgi:hypothetical protein